MKGSKILEMIDRQILLYFKTENCEEIRTRLFNKIAKYTNNKNNPVYQLYKSLITKRIADLVRIEFMTKETDKESLFMRQIRKEQFSRSSIYRKDNKFKYTKLISEIKIKRYS